MDKRSLARNLMSAFAAQGVAFVCSAVMSLLVPKILGVEEYGYYQLFIFYTSYASFFALGLFDGVYLEQGGKSRNEIDKSLIRSEFVVGLCYQIAIAFVIAFYASVVEEVPQRRFVLIALAVFMVVSNATYYLGYVFQSMNETRLFSRGTVIDRVVFLVPMLLCIVFGIADFRAYVAFYVLARCAALCYSLWNARDFFRAPFMLVGDSVRRAFGSMKAGIVLTVANVSFMLIMGFARFMVDSLWGIETFGKLSLALSLVNFAVAFISQASMVLFPALRQSDESSLRRYYCVLREELGSILPFAYLLYFPLRLFVGFWLPQYEESLYYLIYLMPICVFSVQNNVLYNTYYKVRNEPRKLLWVNVRAFVISAVGVCLAALFIGDAVAVVLLAVCGIASCLAMSDRYLSRLYGCWDWKLLAATFGVTAGFVTVNSALDFGWAFLVSVFILGVFSVFQHRELGKVVKRAIGYLRTNERRA